MKWFALILLSLITPFTLLLASDLVPVTRPVADDGSQQNTSQFVPALPLPITTESPGEMIGITAYAYQSNGSMGNKIAVDQFGGIHAVWMKSIGGSRPRYVYYNFRSENDSVWVHNPNGTAISGENGTGYITLDLLAGGETIAAYHSFDATPMYSNVAVDAFRGFGIFTEFSLSPSGEYIWPYIARNVNSGRLHMVMAPYEGTFALNYTYSTDDGATWSTYALVDTPDINGYIIAASPVSDKTAILYCKLNSTEEFFDVFYNESIDGIAWDFRFPVNITGFTANDSLSAWADIDAVYDYNDDIHILYQGAIAYDGNIYLNSNQVRHWCQASGHSVITTGPESACAQINYCLCVAKVNIGVDPSNNNVFAVWSEMNNDDVSMGGYSNGELYAAGSDDGGATWYPKVNLTNSHTPGCGAMDCDSDVWASLAEKVDSKLHIIYIDDNDAGAAWNNQGVWTTNAVLYLEVEAGALVPTSVKDMDADLPFDFELGENYPNPFNASTAIRYSLTEPSDVIINIYDILGRKVETMVQGEQSAGYHQVIWDAKGHSSGVYFYGIQAGDYTEAKKMLLLK
jgi:hypothetical protein